MYATLGDVKAYLGISGTGDDALLNVLITRTSAAIDTYCGRTFHAAEATAKAFDARDDVAGPYLYFGDDCASITSVTNGNGETVTAASYVTEPRGSGPYYAIKLLPSTGLYWTWTTDHENAISVSAYWAYSTTPPSDIVQACIRWTAHQYRLKDSQVYDVQAMPEQGIITVPQGIPKDVLLLLGPYRRRVG